MGIFDFDPLEYAREERARTPHSDEQGPGPLGCVAGAALLVVVLFAGALAFLVVLFFPVALVYLWPSLALAMEAPWMRALAVVLVTGFSGLLYLLRRHQRLVYGVLEIAAGMTTCWASLSRLGTDRLTVSLGLLGGAYIIVRGLDNAAQAQARKG